MLTGPCERRGDRLLTLLAVLAHVRGAEFDGEVRALRRLSSYSCPASASSFLCCCASDSSPWRPPNPRWVNSIGEWRSVAHLFRFMEAAFLYLSHCVRAIAGQR